MTRIDHARNVAALIATVAIIVSWVTGPTSAAQNTISAKDLTCYVHDGSFVLDVSDFKALAGAKITPATFVKLNAETRKAVCETRGAWRLIRADKFAECDMAEYYKNYSTRFFADSEIDKVIEAQSKVMASELLNGPQECH